MFSYVRKFTSFDVCTTEVFEPARKTASLGRSLRQSLEQSLGMRLNGFKFLTRLVEVTLTVSDL